MNNFSYLSNSDPKYIDDLYKKYQSNPNDLDLSWQKFFEGFDFSNNFSSLGSSKKNILSDKETSVNNLINAYRIFGHLNSDTNPVRVRRDHKIKFNLESFYLTNSDMNNKFQISSEIGLRNAKLDDIISKLKTIYLGSIGLEYMHIRDTDEVNWLKSWIEDKWPSLSYSSNDKIKILSNKSSKDERANIK